MKSDKELMREGRFQEALGKNYSSKPFTLLNFADQNNPVDDTEFYSTKEEAKERAIVLGWENYFIADLNADWL